MALGKNPSILPQSDWNSLSVRSEVQHFADAGAVPLKGVKGVVHLEASVVFRMLVVV